MTRYKKYIYIYIFVAIIKVILLNFPRPRRPRDVKRAIGTNIRKQLNDDVIPHPQATRKASDTRTPTKLISPKMFEADR